LAASDEWDLIIVDTPPSRSALDFLDAPSRLSTALDSRMIRMLTSPARAGGKGLRRMVNAGFTVFSKAVSTILGAQLLADASAFMQAFDSTFGGFRERAHRTAELMSSPGTSCLVCAAPAPDAIRAARECGPRAVGLMSSPGTSFLVVAAPEPDAMREAGYFVQRLSEQSMPLAGLVANRTHPVLADLSDERARAAAESLERGDTNSLAAAVLRLHADRVVRANREQRLLSRFTRAHGRVPITHVPALPSDVHNLGGLRDIGERLAAH